MKRSSLVVGLASLVLGAAAVVVAAGKPQTTCPASDRPIDKAHKSDWQGQRVYFCCPKCPPKFRADPEKYFAKVAKAGVALENVQTTCPVSNESLGDEMGEPASTTYKGRTVKFCCKMCQPEFEKEPEKYLSKLPGEQSGPAK